MDVLASIGRAVDSAVHAIHARSALGIDIGTSSIKIVQLRKEQGDAVLETYGSIELAPYADLAIGESVRVEAQRAAVALLDVIAGARATARRGAFALPLSSAFTALLTTPLRDQAQMRQIVPLEAKQYIPAPLESVMLDWRVVSARSEERPFESAERKAAVTQQTQRVLLVAIRNDAMQEMRLVAKHASVGVSFFEVEMFSAARAAGRTLGEGTLLVDLGAGSTKIYALDEHGEALVSHAIPRGGAHITKALLESGMRHFASAEEAKRRERLGGASAMSRLIEQELTGIFAEAKHVLDDYNAKEARAITRAILFGGGALMGGIVPYASSVLGIEANLAAPFLKVRGPEVLADILAEVGPIYEVATGLALRALE